MFLKNLKSRVRVKGKFFGLWFIGLFTWLCESQVRKRLKHKTNFGFTLIELLIVIAIIGLLSSVVLASLNSARNKAKYARAQVDIDQIKKAMLIYKIDIGELPPPGDLCSACSNPPNATWTVAIDALVNGGYLSGRIDKDPWDNYYGYDDNDCNSNPGTSSVFTAGADKVNGTADDYSVLIT